MSHVGRVQDASHGMYAPMTPAQGKFLTSLLDQATAKDAHAGNTAREATRALYAEGRLTKQCASTWIDVLKRFLDTPGTEAATVLRTAPAPRGSGPSPTPLTDSVREAVASVRAKAAATRPTGAPGVARNTHGPNRTMEYVRTWTAERAAADLTEAVPF